MGYSFEDVCLLLITVQGFFVMYWEYRVYRLHNDRHTERTNWRIAKQKQKLKKTEPKPDDSQITSILPLTCGSVSTTSKDENALSAKTL